ncbi:MAG: alpha/beta fold hydrolase [Defluviicoccus sp.]|nr:alpha/beta fold hydrolase [Defluviicoccus sp.]MDE0275183.1 alpha/beta fold hydrolase [Defluviicoccus sp.]
MDFSQAKFVDVDGINTRYFDRGTGETIVLFHGGNFGSHHGADCAADWNLNFDGLAEECRVIAVDKIGQGYTDNPETDDDYTMARVVRHALGFLDALDLQDCHIVGHSRGAYLTCRMTLENPARIKSNIMVDTNTLGPGQGRNHIVFTDTPKPYLSRESQRWVLENYSWNPKIVTEDWLDELMRVAALPKYLKSVRKMLDEGLLDRVFVPQLGREKRDTFDRLMSDGTQRPNLIVWGLNDPTATIDQGFALYEMVVHKEPRTEMHVFNHAGHFSYREHPEAFNRLILDYVHSL